jgi:hypothetical protein
MKTLITSAAVAALLGGAALAQEGQTRQLGAHVHGEARLSVAIDDSGLAFAELTGAAWNFFGFEAEAQTEEQHEAIRSVSAALSDTAPITWPDRAGCELVETSVESMMMESSTSTTVHHHEDEPGDHHAGHAHDDHAHDHEAHGAEHGHDAVDHENGHDQHDHGHEHHASETHAHHDVTASWTWRCERAQAADRFNAEGVFQALPRLERIDVEAFDGSRAAVRTLTPGDGAVRLN